MIKYYYTYFINKKFSLETRNNFIYSVLEYALSKKSIIFLFLLNFNYEEKKLQDKDAKIVILLY